jgi:hypothetical protein
VGGIRKNDELTKMSSTTSFAAPIFGRRIEMIELSESAQKQLEEHFRDKERTPIRIYLATGG